jgi:hypothetical protein
MTPEQIAAGLTKAQRDYYGCCHSWRFVGHTPECRHHPHNRKVKEQPNDQ